LVVTFLIESVTEWTWVQSAEGLLAILCLLVSIHEARRIFQIIGSLFIAAGIVCMVWAQIPVTRLPSLMISNVTLISLLYMLPYINRVIRVGGYDRHVSRWLYMPSGSLGQLYVRSVAVSCLLSLFLFFASVPLLHRVLTKHLQHQDSELAKRFMGMSILRGFGTVSIWSPVEPLVAMAVLLTGISYISLFPWMFGLSIVLFAVGGLWGLAYRNHAVGAGREVEDPFLLKRPSWSKTIAFIAALVLLISSAYTLHSVTKLSFFAAMTFVLLPFSIIWSLLMRRFSRFLASSRKQWRENTDSLRHLLVLFLSFGFFNSAVTETSLLQLMNGPVEAIAQWPAALFLFILIVSLALPIIGIHPFVVMSLFGVFLQPVLNTINPLSIAIILITTCICSSFMGTFNTTVTIMSGLLQVNPYRITVWNLTFGLVFGLIGVGLSLWLL
jgi:hypothetical protein